MSCSALTNIWVYFRANLGDIHWLIHRMWTGCLAGQKSETYSPITTVSNENLKLYMAFSLRTSKQVLARLLHYLHFKHVSWTSIQHCASAPVICLDTLLNWLHLWYPFLGLSSPQFWISRHTPKKPTAKAEKWLIPMILAGLGSFTPRFWSSKMPGTETCHFWVFRGMVSWAIPSTLGFFFPGDFLVRNFCKWCRWLRDFVI